MAGSLSQARVTEERRCEGDGGACQQQRSSSYTLPEGPFVRPEW